ncbi:Tmem97 [Symbiodinium natans]|uniref:Tmem97 protein n=1 Tax=Symbiodinium natans TaxID=878477 RepID=A0A812M5C7_9DINO|nr:Tmem97 [Symbiodinium natans]
MAAEPWMEKVLYCIAALCSVLPIMTLAFTMRRVVALLGKGSATLPPDRGLDACMMVFFLFNFPFITYIVDIEQIIIADPGNFQYPFWPPPIMVDLIHWYGKNYDPLLMARPTWWKVTIWWDVLFFGPFYVLAFYAFLFRKRWIRFPSICYSCVLLTIVSVILAEETFGPHAAPQRSLVLLLNAPWVVEPACLLVRMLLEEKPFGEAKESF